LDTPASIVLLNDIQLLELLCSREDDNLAYKHFVERFLPDVTEECNRICKARKLDSHIGIQISHDTFERVRKYKSFKKDEIRLPNQRKGIIVYLMRISIRLFDDHHRMEKRKDITHKTYFEEILDEVNPNIDVKDLKNKKDLAVFIFNKLNPKEKKVILTDLEYKKHQKYLPDDVTTTLATEMNVKNDTVRKIRNRAIEKIKKAIDEINQN
jgi:DNA-directed RNA polymerase specialized sigma24 family protein